MYFMLRAANSWPGAELQEYKGNPPVHDILDRLGLLDAVTDKKLDVEMEIDYSDGNQSNTDEASTVGSPQHAQNGTQLSPKLHPEPWSA
ncbi:unnamed protein product [Aureobasidium uvarum]|uniref:Uncharacterized protein n=1 Tax=Aureobasidium uvarum TaxID=2773716 RepID=A0A9N8KCN2_9PEZI|nr:unnamed protein product [Aureobasidium uvarum]